MKIVVVDYGMGNIFSVLKKVKSFTDNVQLSSKKEDILGADKLILPGVGSLGKAMSNLKELDLIDVLNTVALEKKTPVLGVCLGMQLMSTYSEEGDSKGLNWIPGKVKKFDLKDTLTFKAPHSGWNQVKNTQKHELFDGVADSEEFYFVHSYYYSPDLEENVLSESIYESRFCSAVVKDNIIEVAHNLFFRAIWYSNNKIFA